MKKTLLVLGSLIFGTGFGQQFCGFQKHQDDLDKANPQNKIARENFENQLLKMDIQSFLKNIGADSKSALYTGTIYEIPVVVHVIQSSTSGTSGNSLYVSDAEITSWIDNANKQFACTAGGDFYAEGTGADGGNVIPFKLVLAKRNAQCTATTGIVRYDASTNTGYNSNGLNSNNTNGMTTDQMRTLAPHWPESSYYNMYIVTGFDGNTGSAGLMGWAALPTTADNQFETVMKVSVVKNTNDTTLAHEFAHSLGLLHTFGDANSNGGACPATTNDCSVDDDKVCDTERTQSLLQTNPVPTNTTLNTCTNANYQGVQYNIMNYTSSPRKFTAGQRTRALAQFIANKGALTNSLAGYAPGTNPGPGSLTASSCNPTSTSAGGQDWQAGPSLVNIGTINNRTSVYSSSNTSFYIDYSTQNCLNKAVSTDLVRGQQHTIKVNFLGNSQTILVWIDYNNNGTFESSELVLNSGLQNPQNGFNSDTQYTGTFTSSATALLNTPLRMRVKVDMGTVDTDPCSALNRGQVEDYTVRFTQQLGTVETASLSSQFVIYNISDNTLMLMGTKKGFGAYKIYDFSGRLLQSGNENTTNIPLNFKEKGNFIITYFNTGKEINAKFTKK